LFQSFADVIADNNGDIGEMDFFDILLTTLLVATILGLGILMQSSERKTCFIAITVTAILLLYHQCLWSLAFLAVISFFLFAINQRKGVREMIIQR